MRRTLKKNLRKRRSRGGGWSTGPGIISAGNLENIQYAGPGKDCTGNAMSHRPGWMSDPSFKGLPGMAGGKRRSRRTRGGTIPGVASFEGSITNPNVGPVSGSLTPKPAYFPNTTGAAGTVGQPEVVASWPGAPIPVQRGGRYGFFPGMGPLNPMNGVGVSPPFFARIPCEIGTTNPLNMNPNGIQTLTTAPTMPPVMRGGSAMSPAPYSGSSGSSAANFPTIQVGQADSMRYYAPTAGYRNDFETMRAPSAVPGLTIQTPYDARAFNQACIKTGGSRRSKRSRGGAMPVAGTAAEYSKVTMNEIGKRSDFDGSNGGLPVRFGGSRKNRRRNKNRK